MSDLTNRIDALLSERKLRRADLVRATGIPDSTIRTWITRNSAPSVDAIVKISEFFGVSVEYLYYGYSTNSSEENKIPYRLNHTEADLIDSWRMFEDKDREDLVEFIRFKMSKYPHRKDI